MGIRRKAEAAGPQRGRRSEAPGKQTRRGRTGRRQGRSRMTNGENARKKSTILRARTGSSAAVGRENKNESRERLMSKRKRNRRTAAQSRVSRASTPGREDGQGLIPRAGRRAAAVRPRGRWLPLSCRL